MDHFPQIINYLDRALPICSCKEMGYRLYFGDRRVSQAKQHIYQHLEAAILDKNTDSEFHIRDNGKYDCPLCEKPLDLEKDDLPLLKEDDPCVISCSNGHDFQAYYKDKNIFLFYDSANGPFSTD